MKLKKTVNLHTNIFMKCALSQAQIAYKNNEVPVGSVITHENKVISSNFNKVKSDLDPTAHAEILCIREVTKKFKTTNLNHCDLYTTLEPCAMCAQAIAFSKIKCLYFGAYDKKFGAIENGVRLFHSKTYNHTPEIYGGIMEQKAVDLMQKFFIQIRDKNNK